MPFRFVGLFFWWLSNFYAKEQCHFISPFSFADSVLKSAQSVNHSALRGETGVPWNARLQSVINAHEYLLKKAFGGVQWVVKRLFWCFDPDTQRFICVRFLSRIEISQWTLYNSICYLLYRCLQLWIIYLCVIKIQSVSSGALTKALSHRVHSRTRTVVCN